MSDEGLTYRFADFLRRTAQLPVLGGPPESLRSSWAVAGAADSAPNIIPGGVINLNGTTNPFASAITALDDIINKPLSPVWRRAALASLILAVITTICTIAVLAVRLTLACKQRHNHKLWLFRRRNHLGGTSYRLNGGLILLLCSLLAFPFLSFAILQIVGVFPSSKYALLCANLSSFFLILGIGLQTWAASRAMADTILLTSSDVQATSDVPERSAWTSMYLERRTVARYLLTWGSNFLLVMTIISAILLLTFVIIGHIEGSKILDDIVVLINALQTLNQQYLSGKGIDFVLLAEQTARYNLGLKHVQRYRELRFTYWLIDLLWCALTLLVYIPTTCALLYALQPLLARPGGTESTILEELDVPAIPVVLPYLSRLRLPFRQRPTPSRRPSRSTAHGSPNAHAQRSRNMLRRYRALQLHILAVAFSLLALTVTLGIATHQQRPSAPFDTTVTAQLVVIVVVGSIGCVVGLAMLGQAWADWLSGGEYLRSRKAVDALHLGLVNASTYDASSSPKTWWQSKSSVRSPSTADIALPRAEPRMSPRKGEWAELHGQWSPWAFDDGPRTVESLDLGMETAMTRVSAPWEAGEVRLRSDSESYIEVDRVTRMTVDWESTESFGSPEDGRRYLSRAGR